MGKKNPKTIRVWCQTWNQFLVLSELANTYAIALLFP